MIRNNDQLSGGVVTRNGSNAANLAKCRSEHSILAIKRGSVAKVVNTDAQGRATFRLRELSSIYKSKDANSTSMDQSFSWPANRNGGFSGDCWVKLELPSPEEGDHHGISNINVLVDDSESIFHKNDADLETNHNDDELNGMTLKELRTRCKKQKIIHSDVSGEADARSHTHVQCRKSEHASIELVEVESDLEEPLIVLKEKLSKKSKPERKKRKCISPCSPDSVISTQELSEKKQSSSNAVQHFMPVDGRSPKQALSMDNAGVFHLKKIEECDSRTVVAAAKCSGSSSIPKPNLFNCTISQVSEEFQGDESETIGSGSLGHNVHNCSVDEALNSETYKLNLGINVNATEIHSHVLSSMQEWDLCSISSPGVAYSGKKKIHVPDSLSELTAVTAGHCFDHGFTANCHLLCKSLDVALDWNDACGIESINPPPSVEKSQFSTTAEASVEPPSHNLQISPQESAEKDFGVIRSSFSPFACHSCPVSETSDHGSEIYDAGKSTVREREITLEAFDPIEERNNVAAHCMMDNKAVNSSSDSSNAECEDNNSTVEVPSQNLTVSSIRMDCARTNVSDDISSIKSEVSVSIGNKELSGEVSTDNCGNVHSLQTREHCIPKTHFTSTYGDSSLLSGSTNCLHSIDACLDVTEKRLMNKVEEKQYYLRVHGENSCSNGFSSPVDMGSSEAQGRQECLSQNCDQSSSMDGNLNANNSPEKIDKISIHTMGMFPNEVSNQSVVASSRNVGHEDEVLECSSEHPIKLLSNRKVLSPTSQEKLCQAADAESRKNFKIGKKLLFEKRTNSSSPPESGHRVSELLSSPEMLKFSGTGKKLSFEKRVIPSSESSQRIHEQTLSPERASKKPKNWTVPPTTKGILKSSLSSVKPCSCMESSLIHKHTQEAITFSQRQMHDIESLAMKLVRGLMSMKNIVEATLSSEACLSEPSKYDIDQMKIAIGNASELEDTTKKWLSMMGRDCNRFCKILRSTICKPATPIDGLRKERKKITFADEAGGTLCHVKVFEGQSTSLVDSEYDEVDPFPQALVQ